MSTWLKRWLARHRENGFVALLFATLLLLLTFPFLHGTFWLRLLRGIMVLVLFLPSVYAYGKHRWLRVPTAALFLASLGTLVWELGAWEKQAELWHSAANTCYFMMLVIILVRFVITQDTVSRNVVSATLVVYLLLAFSWTFLYDLVEILHPGSFANIAVTEHDPNQRVAFYYYSMTTITTVGFGDIVPVTSLARMLTVTEALVGQFYMVAAVATVVGLRASTLAETRKAKRPND